MAGTALDMTSPRPGGSGPVYGVYGRPDPGILDLDRLSASGVLLRQIPTDVLLALETGEPALQESALARIADLRGRTLAGAVGFDDWWTTALSALNPRFPLAAARRVVTDKGDLYRRLAQHGVAVPRFACGKLSLELIASALDQTGPRPVLKPATGAGSRGVYRYNSTITATENLALYRQLLAAGHIDSSTDILVAEYVGGAEALEISVDVIVCNGMTMRQVVHEKLTATQVHPYVDRVMASPPINGELSAALPILSPTVEAIVAALSLDHGVLHIELRLHQDAWYVLDVGVRPGSGLVSAAVHARTGIDPRMAHLAASIDQPLDSASIEAARGQYRATCIACCYVSDHHRDVVTLSEQAKLAAVLRAEPAVIGWHLNTSEVSDPVYRPDVGLSLGVSAETACGAMQQLRSLVEPYAYSIA